MEGIKKKSSPAPGNTCKVACLLVYHLGPVPSDNAPGQWLSGPTLQIIEPPLTEKPPPKLEFQNQSGSLRSGLPAGSDQVRWAGGQ